MDADTYGLCCSNSNDDRGFFLPLETLKDSAAVKNITYSKVS